MSAGATYWFAWEIVLVNGNANVTLIDVIIGKIICGHPTALLQFNGYGIGTA